MIRRIWRRIWRPRRHWCILPGCWFLARPGQYVCQHHPRFWVDPGHHLHEEDS
jgi:hypothetical protein